MTRRFRLGALAVVTAVLTFAGVVPAGASARPVGGTFTDDDGNVHEQNIEALAEAGITYGCNPPDNDEFCPSRVVTRGQMAAFLVRALSLPASMHDPFTDDDGSIFEDDIAALADAGITLGCNPPDNDLFCPDDPVTRGQMAAFLVRGYGYVDGGSGDYFTDDDASVFEPAIDALAYAGVTVGCNPPTNDRYCPNDPVRRDQMASFLARAENLGPIPVLDPADWYLTEDGVGSVLLGTETEVALLELALLGDPAVTGDPDEDTGWIDSFSPYGTCPGSEIRVVRWGDLETFFTRTSMVDEGELFTYRVWDPLDDRTDLRLRTVEGLMLGDDGAMLEALYGSRVELTYVDVFDLWLYWIDAAPPSDYTGLGGSISGDGASDLVTSIEAGERCGE
jgi:hypothetical protein